MEMIIFIVLAGLLIPVLILAFNQGVQGMNMAPSVAAAGFLAQEKIEWFLQYNYDDSRLTAGSGSDNVTVNGKKYFRKWNISYFNPDSSSRADTGYKQIEVSITTADLSQPIGLYTLITRH